MNARRRRRKSINFASGGRSQRVCERVRSRGARTQIRGVECLPCVLGMQTHVRGKEGELRAAHSTVTAAVKVGRQLADAALVRASLPTS
jgi:hypothetical protein